MPPNTWNFGLVFGKQPDADLGGPAPVDAVPTEILSPCTVSTCTLKLEDLSSTDYLCLGFLDFILLY